MAKYFGAMEQKFCRERDVITASTAVFDCPRWEKEFSEKSVLVVLELADNVQDRVIPGSRAGALS